jgi:hypothetical protein
MPHIFTLAEYPNMLFVHVFCDDSATATVEEYRRRFPMRRIPDSRVFSKVCSKLLACFPVLMFHLNEHVNKMWRNKKTFLKWYSVALLLARERLSTHLGVSRTRVWRTLPEDGLYPFHPQLCKMYTKGTVQCV